MVLLYKYEIACFKVSSTYSVAGLCVARQLLLTLLFHKHVIRPVIKSDRVLISLSDQHSNQFDSHSSVFYVYHF